MMRRIIKTFFYFALFIILIGCKTKNPIEIAAGKVFAGINSVSYTHLKERDVFSAAGWGFAR